MESRSRSSFWFELEDIETNTQHISQPLFQLKSGIMELSFRELCCGGKH